MKWFKNLKKRKEIEKWFVEYDLNMQEVYNEVRKNRTEYNLRNQNDRNRLYTIAYNKCIEYTYLGGRI